MYKLVNAENQTVASGHTIKTLKHKAKKPYLQNQRLTITTIDIAEVLLERNAGTWRAYNARTN